MNIVNDVSFIDSKTKMDHIFKSEGQAHEFSLFQTYKKIGNFRYFETILVLIVLFV